MLCSDSIGRSTELTQGLRHGVDHVARSADEVLGDFGGREERGSELSHMPGVQLAVVNLGFLRLAAHEEVQRHAVGIAVLQGEQLLQAHRPRHRAIAVEENDPTRRPGLQPAAHDRDNRCDAAAGRKGDAGPTPRRRRMRREAAVGRQHVQRITRLHVLREVIRQAAFRVNPGDDTQQPLARRTDQRVRSPHLLVRERGA